MNTRSDFPQTLYFGFPNHLTQNIQLKEAILWSQHLKMSNDLRLKAIEEAQQALTLDTYTQIKAAAIQDQLLRDHLNRKFDYLDHEICIRFTSWLRSYHWERLKGRAGTSTHTEGHGRDITFFLRPKTQNIEPLKFPTIILNKIYREAEMYAALSLEGLGVYKHGNDYRFLHRDKGPERIWRETI